MVIKPIKRFLQLESASSIILFAAAFFSIFWANSSFDYIHQRFIGRWLFTINDGLMTLFFLMVGLELKRGYLDGQLSRFSQVILPAFAALGGMIVPALIYCWVNYSNPTTLQGWATPVATDIAFAVGVLSLFGSRVPTTLKLFLLALAIFDDIGAIIIISFFYSHGISWAFIIISLLIVLALFILNVMSVRSLIPYLILGALLWICLFFSGIHPTIAGVLLALTIPSYSDMNISPLNKLENNLHPWVAFLIMPLFALANAGFTLAGMSWQILTEGVVLGIILGLFLGKQIGVFLFSWILIKLKFAKLPEPCTWAELYGVSLLCGIGFTMSLFLGTLSFANESTYLAQVRLGVITGSFLSGIFGASVLWLVLKKSSFNGKE